MLILAAALGLWYVTNGWIVKPYRIPSASMEPTLQIGDRVLVAASSTASTTRAAAT